MFSFCFSRSILYVDLKHRPFECHRTSVKPFHNSMTFHVHYIGCSFLTWPLSAGPTLQSFSITLSKGYNHCDRSSSFRHRLLYLPTCSVRRNAVRRSSRGLSVMQGEKLGGWGVELYITQKVMPLTSPAVWIFLAGVNGILGFKVNRTILISCKQTANNQNNRVVSHSLVSPFCVKGGWLVCLSECHSA